MQGDSRHSGDCMQFLSLHLPRCGAIAVIKSHSKLIYLIHSQTDQRRYDETHLLARALLQTQRTNLHNRVVTNSFKEYT